MTDDSTRVDLDEVELHAAAVAGDDPERAPSTNAASTNAASTDTASTTESSGADPFEDLCERLSADALEALRGRDFETAQRLALELRTQRYSAYFEVQALIHLDQNHPKRALKILRQGVARAPGVWLLWQLLGNTLSDLEQFAQALECYDRASALPGADEVSLAINRATVLSRLGEHDAALRVLDDVEPLLFQATPGAWWRVRALQLRELADLGMCDDVRARAGELFASSRKIRDEAQLQASEDELCVAWTQIGVALEACQDLAHAHTWARLASDVDRLNSGALALMRRTAPDAPLGTAWFQVLLEGRWSKPAVADDDATPQGFITSLLVVARDEAQARALAFQLESPRHADAVTVADCSKNGRCKRQFVGVYEVGPYNLYPMEAT